MRKFILRTLLFVIPFAVLFVTTSILHSSSEAPDLLRLGNIPVFNNHHLSDAHLNKEEKFEKLSNPKGSKYKILTIGDSFSEQAGYGYKNYLAQEYSVLHVDRFISKNQFQTLIDLINGNFFERFDIQFVILQGVERQFIKNITDIKYESQLLQRNIDSVIKNQPQNKNDYGYKVFSPTTLTFPTYHLPRYFFEKNYLSNDMVYVVESNSTSLFSNSSSKLLFYKEDLLSVKTTNINVNITKANDVINIISEKLKQKGVQLIFLPSPDKYDFYYEFITDKTLFTEPLFFKSFSSLDKKYIYIDSKDILKQHLSSSADIYFYGDTHWSPVASKIIASEISQEIRNRQ